MPARPRSAYEASILTSPSHLPLVGSSSTPTLPPDVADGATFSLTELPPTAPTRPATAPPSRSRSALSPLATVDEAKKLKRRQTTIGTQR